MIDEDQQTLIRCTGARLKSYAEKFIPPLNLARQNFGNVATNMRKFLRNDFHMKSGMKCLIESFYRSITEDAALPIPYHEILRTSRIMDAIFGQLNAKTSTHPLTGNQSLGPVPVAPVEVELRSKPDPLASV